MGGNRLRPFWSAAGLLLALLSCSSKSITVGVVLPESGEWSQYGRAVKEGVQVAETYLRQTGNLPTLLRLRYLDTRSDPDAAREAVRTLARDGAPAIIGGVTTTEALAMIPAVDEEEIVLLSPSASAASLAGRSDWFFRVYPSDRHEVMTAAKFLVEDLAASTVLILAEDTDWSRGMARDLALELKRLGSDRAPVVLLPARSEAYGPVINRALGGNPKALFIAAYADALREALAVVRSGPWNGPVVTTSAFNAPGILRQVGVLAEGLYFFRPPYEPDDPNKPLAGEFAARFRSRFGHEPEVFSAYGFDALLALGEAVRSGGTAPGEMRRGLRSITNLPGATGTLSFLATGEALKFPRVFQVRDGAAVDYLDAMERYRQRLLRELERTKRELGP